MNFTIDQWEHGKKKDIEIYSTHNEEKYIECISKTQEIHKQTHGFSIKKCAFQQIRW